MLSLYIETIFWVINMIKELKIENKVVSVFCNENHKENLPVAILNTYGNEGKEIFERCNKIQTKEFILIAISNLDWDNDMTPWFAPKLNNNDKDCLGKADDYLKTLIEKIIPETKKYIENELNVNISYYAIAGYSLGGLFAIYSAYKTNLFSRIASASGSFWYPNFIEFANKNKISENIDKIYFSLGNKESKVKNEVLATVEENTKKLEQMYKLQGIKTIYEENDGNHFKDAVLRMAKGIKWIL